MITLWPWGMAKSYLSDKIDPPAAYPTKCDQHPTSSRHESPAICRGAMKWPKATSTSGHFEHSKVPSNDCEASNIVTLRRINFIFYPLVSRIDCKFRQAVGTQATGIGLIDMCRLLAMGLSTWSTWNPQDLARWRAIWLKLLQFAQEDQTN